MKFILSTVATAALAMVASSAAIRARDDVALPLPARFAMYLETAEASINGLRIQYAGSDIVINHNRLSPAEDGFFLGGDGRVSIDLSVHGNPGGLYPGGAWNVMFTSSTSLVLVASEEFQEVLKSWGPAYTPVVSVFVQTSDHKLRLVDSKGSLVNRLQICGAGASSYQFWWDGIGYMNCAPVELRIEEL